MIRLGTGKSGWHKLVDTNDTSSSFTSRIPTITKPTTNILNQNTPIIENVLMLAFFGAGTENTTFDARVIGWNAMAFVKTDGSPGELWIPTPLAQFSCTLSATVGVAGAPVTATDKFVDTITAASFNPTGGSEIVSPTGDLIAHAVLDAKGCDLVQIDFDMTGATSGNALSRWL